MNKDLAEGEFGASKGRLKADKADNPNQSFDPPRASSLDQPAAGRKLNKNKQVFFFISRFFTS